MYCWKVWTASRSVYHPDSSTTKPHCCKDTICSWAMSYWNMQGLPWVGECVALKTSIYFQLWWCLSRCDSYQFDRHKLTPVPLDRLDFELHDYNKANGSSPLYFKEFPKKESQLLISLTTEQFYFLPLFFSSELWSREGGFLDHVYIWLLLCMIEF